MSTELKVGDVRRFKATGNELKILFTGKQIAMYQYMNDCIERSASIEHILDVSSPVIPTQKIVGHVDSDGRVYLTIKDGNDFMDMENTFNSSLKRIELTPEMFGWKVER